MRSLTGRPRYFLIITAGYLLVGLIIVARSLVSGAYGAIVLGGVFLLLAGVRIRDYRSWRVQQP